MLKDQMEKIYKDLPLEKIPWNMETPPSILQDIVNTEKRILTMYTACLILREYICQYASVRKALNLTAQENLEKRRLARSCIFRPKVRSSH